MNRDRDTAIWAISKLISICVVFYPVLWRFSFKTFLGCWVFCCCFDGGKFSSPALLLFLIFCCCFTLLFRLRQERSEREVMVSIEPNCTCFSSGFCYLKLLLVLLWLIRNCEQMYECGWWFIDRELFLNIFNLSWTILYGISIFGLKCMSMLNAKDFLHRQKSHHNSVSPTANSPGLISVKIHFIVMINKLTSADNGQWEEWGVINKL